MHTTEFIGRQLTDTDGYEIQKKEAICSFSGEQIQEAVRLKTIISGGFTDYGYLKASSGFASKFAARCLKSVIPYKDKAFGLRLLNYVVTEKSIRSVLRGEVIDLLLNPPEPPFVLCLTFSGQKHTSFKSRINHNRDEYTVTTDLGDVQINREALKALLETLNNWYSIIPEKASSKQQPTWFTKDDILLGCRNYKRIEDYVESHSYEQYFEEEKKISFWRGSLYLKTIVNFLGKDTE